MPHKRMFQYDAVLFDMDGTLLNTVDDIADALNHTLAQYRYPAVSTQDVIRFIGNGAYRLVRRALPQEADDAAAERVLADYRQRYAAHYNRRTHPYTGVVPMLTALGEAGLKLAVISNKGDAVVKQLTKAHFGSLIHNAVGARNGVPLKPEPDMLLAAMRELNTEPERTLFIGDADTDFAAAGNAGTDCILARWGYGNPEALSLLNPLYFANDPAELPMLILQDMEELP